MLISGAILLSINNCEIIVTNKRVYGKATFRKRVDLPLDSISAVGTSILSGIDVGTSSGRIHFKLLKNNIEIHSVISNLLIRRHQTENLHNIQNSNNVDELKKFKELLDSGIITQDEFVEKKKQLLGLNQINTESYELMPDNFNTEIGNLEDETEQKLSELAEPYKKRLFEFIKQHKKKTFILLLLLAIIVSAIFIFVESNKTNIPTDGFKICDYYGDVILENDDIESAKKKISNGQNCIELKLSQEGQEKFAEATKVISKSKNNHYTNVYRNGILICTPSVTQEINTDTILITMPD